MSTKQEEISDELAEKYVERHGRSFDLEEAKKRIAENYRKEVENVDAKEVALKAMKYLRQLSPKLDGIEQREQGYASRVSTLEFSVKKINNEVDSLQEEFSSLKEKMLVSVKIMADYHQKMLKTDGEVVEGYKNSLFFKIRKKIKKILCRLNLR